MLSFPNCALKKVVVGASEKVGSAVLCTLLHEYLAGLVSAFTGKNYAADKVEAGPACTMKLQIRTQ